jgi:lipoprotein-anchoring transpeptidase ErfK/SrfK
VAAGFGAAVPAAGVSLPVVPEGVAVGGVEIGGLISPSAKAKIRDQFGEPLHFFHGEKVWAVSPARLGASAGIEDAVSEALRARPGTEVPLRIGVRTRAVRRYVEELNRRFARPAKNAELVGLSNLAPSFTKAKPGRKVDQPAMVRQITRALRSTWRGAQLQLKLVPVQPEVTADDYGSIIVIRRASRNLYLYHGSRLVRRFLIAVGMPEYPTPVGRFEVIVRETNPTWNPPDSPWAAGLGPVPPGVGNPLGTRWIGTSAPAIGIHGTPAPETVGTAASHGCIRMYMDEVEWLFERVEIGTPVFIVSA